MRSHPRAPSFLPVPCHAERSPARVNNYDTDAVNAALEPRNSLPMADAFDDRGAFLASYAIMRKAARSAARTGK